MSMEHLKEAYLLIERHRDLADFSGPKPEEMISYAEQVLGLSFPSTYRHFLNRLGCGDMNGIEFYGIVHANFEESAVPDAIWLTLDERRVSNFPSSLIIISSTGDGSYYAIDTSQSSGPNENPVVMCGPAGQNPTIVAHDFGEYFLNEIRNSFVEEM
jgi:antitoxin YobK